jgi:hypothetical protein
MRVWTREIAGWALTILGLMLFYKCYVLLTGQFHYIWEAAILMIVGVFLFRGGIHLLKVAVAAQICLQDEQTPSGRPTKPAPSDRPRMPSAVTRLPGKSALG